MNLSCSAALLTGKELHTRHCSRQNMTSLFCLAMIYTVVSPAFYSIQEFQTESSYLDWSDLLWYVSTLWICDPSVLII